MQILSSRVCFAILAAGSMFILSCTRQADRSGWKLIYQNDSIGRTLYGSKKELVQAIKRGSPVRVAWGELLKDGSSCVEFAEPEFTTLVNDSDLVVQFPVSMIQTEYLDAAKSYLKTDPPLQWRALMSTDGHYHQFHSDLATGKVTRTMHLKAAMAWYAEVLRMMNGRSRGLLCRMESDWTASRPFEAMSRLAGLLADWIRVEPGQGGKASSAEPPVCLLR